MIPTYSEAIRKKDLLTFDKCEDIYQDIIKSLNENDSNEMECWNDFISYCINYTNVRSTWPLLTNQEKIDKDLSRTSIHNTLLTKLKIIKRLFENKNADIKWFDLFKININLGDEHGNLYRKKVGDLSNHIIYIYALNSR